MLTYKKIWYDSGVILIVWLACIAWTATRLPLEAIPTGDSAAYLALAPYRPPVYGWILNAYRWISGGLAYLPVLQLLMFASGLLIFAVELGRLLESKAVAVAAIVLISLHVGIHEAPSWLMSESTFELFVLAGLGLQFRFVRSESTLCLAGAAACFAMAAGTRTSGLALLLIPVMTSCLDQRQRLAAAVIRTGQVALVAVFVLSIVMTGNFLKNGRFEIGSWTGISLLGKGLLLTEPSDVPDLPQPGSAVAPTAQYLRELIKSQPDLGARLRAQDQAYQDLRFPLFYPAAEQTWPAWAQGDWRTRGLLALDLSQKAIERHPWNYVRLWANDWLSLVLYPQQWPAWATAQGDGTLFPACRLQDNCWVLARDEVPVRTLLAMLIPSLAGIVGGGLVLALRSWRVLRRQADQKTTLCWTLALLLQVSLLGTSAFEAGLVRYTDVTHVLGVTLLLCFASMLAVRIPADRWGRSLTGWLPLPSRNEFLFPILYCAGIFVGLMIFWLSFSFGVLSSIPILFYRGLSLVVVAMVAQGALLGFVLRRGFRRFGSGFPLSSAHLLPIVLVSTALNAAFFVLVPVNIDRSMSVFLLAWMHEHRDRPQTREDLTRALLRIYIDAYGAIDRRLTEQLASGDIVPRGDGYALTERGAKFVILARQLGNLFSTDPRFLHPMATMPRSRQESGKGNSGPAAASPDVDSRIVSSSAVAPPSNPTQPVPSCSEAPVVRTGPRLPN